MSDFYKQVEGWFGTRTEMLQLINQHERIDDSILLKKKSNNQALPANIRRIDSFSAAGIFPREIEQRAGTSRPGWELLFGEEHYYRYCLAIKLRKRGYTLANVATYMKSMTFEQVRNAILKDEIQPPEEKTFSKTICQTDEISEELKRLGRLDGRVLKSDQVRFAVTPWMHVYITRRELQRLAEGDVDILMAALGQRIKTELTEFSARDHSPQGG